MEELINPRTGEIYTTYFRITEDQRLRKQHRISSGERQQMHKKNTMRTQGFETGMLGETLFEDLFPTARSVKEVLDPENDPDDKIVQCYTDYFLKTGSSDLKIDVKTRLYKNEKYKHPASFFNIYVTNDIRNKNENGFYKTDYYAFIGTHENQQQGYWFALISPKLFFEHAEFVKERRDGAMILRDSWCIPLDVAYKLSEHKKLGLNPNYSFEQKDDENSYCFLPKGTPVTVKIFRNETLDELRDVNLKEDQFFKSKDMYLSHTGNGSYKVLFHTNQKEPKKLDFHLLVERNNVKFRYATLT